MPSRKAYVFRLPKKRLTNLAMCLVSVLKRLKVGDGKQTLYLVISQNKINHITQ